MHVLWETGNITGGQVLLTLAWISVKRLSEIMR